MIEYYYIYFVNENFSLEIKMVRIYSDLEGALWTKSGILLYLFR